VGGSLLADRLITLFYTDRFLPAGDALEILIWAEPALLFSGLLSHALLALNRQRQVLVIAFLMLCANLTLNTMLIPSHSYIGASVARTITEGAGILGYGLVVYRLLRWSWWRSVLPLLPGAGGMFLWVWLMQSCSLWIVVPAAAAVYGLGLWITGGVTPGDLAGLSRMWTARQEKQPPFRYDHAT
jgi:O-antigen/teichoic acid export membrane protein